MAQGLKALNRERLRLLEILNPQEYNALMRERRREAEDKRKAERKAK